jgi:hypothetical protein
LNQKIENFENSIKVSKNNYNDDEEDELESTTLDKKNKEEG